MLKYEELIAILNQYKELLKFLDIKGHINLTGGEPLVSPFFFKLLDEFKKDRDLYTFSILTNGTLINEEVAKKISEYNPEYVQVSLEGDRRANDYIRGPGVYDKVGAAIKYLKKYNIFVSLSFTATKLNYKKFPKVVKFAEKLKVDNVWSDRVIPLGSSTDNLVMNLKETEEYLQIMNKERIGLKNKKSETNVAMYRALQFQKTNDFPYHCTAGNTLLTVMENGDLVPCRRMPIYVGNLLKENMLYLYQHSPILEDLKKQEIPSECHKCEHAELCLGGLKCLNYALKGKYNIKDVGCAKVD